METTHSTRGCKLFFRFLAILGIAALTPAPASAAGTLISMGEVSGGGKSQVMVPFYLTPDPPSRQVGSVSAVIHLEGKGLTFQRAEKSFLLDTVNAGFEVTPEKDPQNPDRLILRVEVATKGEPRKALREGLLLSLVFRIEPDAPTGQKVSLVFDKVSATELGDPPKDVQPMASKPGTIEVLSPEQVPYIVCFFFTH